MNPPDTRPNRLGLAALVAWIVMVAIGVASFGVRYVRGTLGDPDIRSVVEAMMLPALFTAVPFAVLAFGVLWPGMRVISTWTRGRASRWIDIVIGGALSAVIILVLIAGGRLIWPQPTTFGEQIARIVRPASDVWLPIAIVVGGMIVGAGTTPGKQNTSGAVR